MHPGRSRGLGWGRGWGWESGGARAQVRHGWAVASRAHPAGLSPVAVRLAATSQAAAPRPLR